MAALIFKFILFSGVLYFSYRLLFSRLHFFRLNRGIIIFIPVLSLLIPLIAAQFKAPALGNQVFGELMNEIVINGQITEAIRPPSESLQWYWVLYILGFTVTSIFFATGLYQGLKILRRSVPAFENIYLSHDASGPFAFFKKIVIPAPLLHNDKLQAIIAHEKAHVKQNHAFDNLYYNILSSVFWFNPFMHLLSHELRQTHECLADEAALQNTSRESYAKLLLSRAFGSEISFDIGNRFFNSSLIKTRITMMYKTKTNTKMKALYLAFLPLLSAMIIVSCNKTEDAVSEENSLNKTEKTYGFHEVTQPPLFEHCDANASHDEQLACFQSGVINYISTNFIYPEKAKELGLEGKIFVGFTIGKDGTTDNIEIKRGLEAMPEDGQKADTQTLLAAKETHEYVIDLIRKIPTMAPAIKDGKKVAVSFIVPINMKLK